MNKTEHHKKAMIEALKSTLSVVTPALEMTGVGRTTFYGWLKDDPEFKKEVDSIADEALDFAESQLFERMKGKIGVSDEGREYIIAHPSDTAIIFYLKTKGKKRGYIERMENINETKVLKVKVGNDPMPEDLEDEVDY